MTVYSKQIVSEIANLYTCKDVHPWGQTCVDASLKMFRSAFIGGSKFFAVMYLAQILLMNKKIKKSDIPDILKSYSRSMTLALLYSNLFITTSCAYWRIFNRLDYNVFKYWAPFLTGCTIFIDHPFRRTIVSRTFIIMAVESLIRTVHGKYYKSDNIDTVAFMFLNAIVMYSIRWLKMKNRKITPMWFFNPPKPKEPEPMKYCPHEETCRREISNAIIKYFTFGLGFSLLKQAFKNPKILVRPLEMISNLLKWNSLKLPSFAATYVGLYKILSCYLCNANKKDSSNYALICGFVSGVAYKLNPNLTLLSSLTTILIYIVGGQIKRKYNLPDFCYQEFGFIIANMILLANRIISADYCPYSFMNIIDMVTSNRANEVYQKFIKDVEIFERHKKM